jgi:hypothetical protein
MKIRDEDGLGHEVARAVEVHRKFAAYKDDENVLLRVAPFEVHHRLNSSSEAKAISRSAVRFAQGIESQELCGIAQIMYAKEKWGDEWQSGPDHHLLRSMIDTGFLPRQFDEFTRTSEPPSHIEAMRRAKEKGYNVPTHYLEPRPVGYGEHEAWAAAITLRDGSGFFWGEPRKATRALNREVICLAGQFIVPDPVEKDRPPYVLDQLWIVQSDEDRIRLLALEIDEPMHQEPEVKKKDARRDAMLTAMGYEVYRVSSWWCAVDPYRSLAEFFTAAGLLSGTAKDFVGSSLTTISDYVCSYCGHPMVRWDDDWILSIPALSGGDMLIHKRCYEKARR